MDRYQYRFYANNSQIDVETGATFTETQDESLDTGTFV